MLIKWVFKVTVAAATLQFLCLVSIKLINCDQYNCLVYNNSSDYMRPSCVLYLDYMETLKLS